MKCRRVVSYDEGERFAKENDMMFFEASAKDYESVERVLDVYARNLMD